MQPSISTDKLQLLLDAATKLPRVAFERLKEVRLDWKEVASPTGGVVVPVITISYYEMACASRFGEGDY
jgi:hypothetical protein